MDIKESHYISRIWFFSRKGTPVDVIATLWRELPDGLWIFDYRFRYYKNYHTVYYSNYRATFNDATVNEEQAVKKLAPFICQLQNEILPIIYPYESCEPFECDITLLQTDNPKKIIETMSLKEYFHIKDLSKVQA